MLVHLNLAAELVSRGHQVSMLAPGCHKEFADKVVSSTHPGVTVDYISYDLNCTFVEIDKRRAATATPAHSIWMILEALAWRTDDVMSNTSLIEDLRAQKDSIDLLIADPLAYGGLLAYQLDIPHIDMDVGTAGSLMEPFMYGAQAAPAYVPTVGTFFPTNGMNIFQRTLNAAVMTGAHAFMDFVYYFPWMWVQNLIRKHHLSARKPYIRPLLLLVNSNFVLEPPRPVAPQTKYVGPMLPSDAKPLPQEFAAWMEGAGPLGVVLISFGGTLQAPTIASQTVLAAIKGLPEVRFVWKLTAEERQVLDGELSRVPNVLVRDWVPQNDLLGHPNMRGFVTQGGYLSIAEAAYQGVPIIGIPFIAGQGELIRFAADQGRGVMLHKDTIRKGRAEQLRAAIHQVLTQPSFHAAAQQARLRLRATHAPYRQQAAEWVEYAIRVKEGGPFLYTQGQKMEWWQVMMLDVAVMLAVVFLTLQWAARRWSEQRRRRQRAAQQQWPEATIVLRPKQKAV
jgi:hypothetical protein